jgi:PAS domain S-box-containing protein
MPVAEVLSRETERPRERWRVSLFLVLGSILLALMVSCGVILWVQRNATLAEGRKRAENLAVILSDHLTRKVETIDTALTQLALFSQRTGGPRAPGAAWEPVLAAALSGLVGVGSLTVVDDQGIVTHSTIGMIVGESRRNQYVFQRLSTDPLTTVVADTPFRSLRDARYLIPLGRRLETADNRFDGVVVATLEPERLRAFYRSVDLGPGGFLTVLHPEGYVLFREPSEADPIGERAAEHPILQALRSRGTAGFVRQQAAGATYLTAFRTTSQAPLVLAVALDERDVLADWWFDVLVAALAILFTGLALLYAGLLLNRQESARAAADRALRRTRLQFQEIMDHAPSEIAIKDLAGRYLLVNRAFEEKHALAPGAGVGKTSYEILPHDIAEAQSAVDRLVAESKMPATSEVILPLRTGERTVLYVKFPLFDAKGEVEAIGLISTDVTDQKQSEAQLAHAQRMEAIGQLTGGIAHDFNNLLTVILGSAELLANRKDDNPDYVTLARLTMEAAEKGAALTQRLLAFGRRQTLEPRSTDVHELISGMDQLLRRTLGAHIDIQHVRGNEVWRATVDPGQLETALINLAVNARDAMPSGGRLTIETANKHLDKDYVVANPDVKPGDYVMIAITDTGTGMPPDVVARAFEPFFTTKEVGKGTGLGLSMVYGFLKQSGGHAKIYSEPGIGTVVRLYLPRALAEDVRPTVAAAAPNLPAGNEIVLLVEDNPLVRAHTETQLQGLGYRVVSVGDAAEAIAWLKQAIKPDLLLTDVIMPGKMNGLELARHMRTRWPDLNVLYMSGYTHGAIAGSIVDAPPGTHLLSKPFRLRELAERVRDALDERRRLKRAIS